MAKWDSLVASIVKSPGQHQVNQAVKMSATIDKMVENKEKAMAKPENQSKIQMVESSRGYGEGRRMGD